MKEVSLYMKNDGTDKVYHMQMVESGGQYAVTAQYGKRGSTLRVEAKTKTPVSEAEAQAIFDAVLKEKMKKGYSTGASGAAYQNPITKDRVTDIAPQLLNQITDIESYIEDDSYMMQEKFDGERLLTKSQARVVIGINKQGLSIPILKDIETFAHSIGDFVVDGELIGDVYHIFDCLSYKGVDMKEKTAEERYALLKTFCNPVETAMTTEEKRAMFERVKNSNLEGVVLKKKDSKYQPGRPASGGNQLKFKFWESATVEVVSNHRSKRSVGVAGYEGDVRVLLGSVTIPANYNIPAVGALVEVEYLYCYKGGSLYQTKYRGERTDQTLADCNMSQIKFKPQPAKLKV